MNPNYLLTAALQIVRLKGRVNATALTQALRITEPEAAALLQTWRQAGAVIDANGNSRITPAGREQLAQRIAQERAGVDQAALQLAYDAFHPLNTEFKQIVTDWQLRDGVANDHADAAYDSGIVAHLAALDGCSTALFSRMALLAPRLAPYPARLAHALQQLQGGDRAWFARPVLDSYHTVWFELHEDLIGLLGLSREAEAIAGRAE